MVGTKIIENYDAEMSIRQGGCLDRLTVPMAGVADCSDTGKSEDAGRSCVLRTEESREERPVV